MAPSWRHVVLGSPVVPFLLNFISQPCITFCFDPFLPCRLITGISLPCSLTKESTNVTLCFISSSMKCELRSDLPGCFLLTRLCVAYRSSTFEQHSVRSVEVLDEASSAAETLCSSSRSTVSVLSSAASGRWKFAGSSLVRRQEIHVYEISLHTCNKWSVHGHLLIFTTESIDFRTKTRHSGNVHVFLWLGNGATLNFKHGIAWNIDDPGLVTSFSPCVQQNKSQGDSERTGQRPGEDRTAGLCRLDVNLSRGLNESSARRTAADGKLVMRYRCYCTVLLVHSVSLRTQTDVHERLWAQMFWFSCVLKDQKALQQVLCPVQKTTKSLCMSIFRCPPLLKAVDYL